MQPDLVMTGPGGAADPDDPKERILRAALDCYTRFGVVRTTMAAVAGAAGVSRATVYRHFPGPRALRDAALDVVAGDVRREVLAATTPEQSLEEFLETYFRVLSAQVAAMRRQQDLLEERETVPWVAYHSHEEPTRRYVARLLQARLPLARSRGELDPALSDAEVGEAVWIAVRAVASIRTSPVLDLDDPVAVGRWFARQVVRGLAT